MGVSYYLRHIITTSMVLSIIVNQVNREDDLNEHIDRDYCFSLHFNFITFSI